MELGNYLKASPLRLISIPGHVSLAISRNGLAHHPPREERTNEVACTEDGRTNRS